jgi:hypothetical protein
VQGPEPLARPGQAQGGGRCSLNLPMEGDLLNQSESCTNAGRRRLFVGRRHNCKLTFDSVSGTPDARARWTLQLLRSH